MHTLFDDRNDENAIARVLRNLSSSFVIGRFYTCTVANINTHETRNNYKKKVLKYVFNKMQSYL